MWILRQYNRFVHFTIEAECDRYCEKITQGSYVWHSRSLFSSKQSNTFGVGSMNVLHEPWFNVNSISICLTSSQPVTLLTWNDLNFIRALNKAYSRMISKIPEFTHVGHTTSILRQGTLHIFEVKTRIKISFDTRLNMICKYTGTNLPLKSTISGIFCQLKVFNTSTAFGHLVEF